MTAPKREVVVTALVLSTFFSPISWPRLNEHTHAVKVEADVTDPLEAQLLPRADGLLRVCLVLPQSGSLGMVGPSALDAALLATHEINVDGRFRPAVVDLVLVDGGRAPTVVVTRSARCATRAPSTSSPGSTPATCTGRSRR